MTRGQLKHSEEILLSVRDLKKHFPVKKGIFRKSTLFIRAVNGVSFDLAPGETLGIVGESGCGKTTLGRCILRLIEPTSGSIIFDGMDLMVLKPEELRGVRASLQIIFQDPFSSLNPRMRVGDIIAEPLKNHTKLTRAEIRRRVGGLMERVGLHPDQMSRYPHEFSGGQRQRIGIARALALNPKLVVCDEPVSALDVSIQAQVINLLERLQEEMRLSYLFISHDLSVVEHISDRVAVMYLGRIVELASDRELYSNPQHPYSRALLSAVPVPDPQIKRRRMLLSGEVPSLIEPPQGCSFHPRCPEMDSVCREEIPQLKDIGEGHFVACHMR